MLKFEKYTEKVNKSLKSGKLLVLAEKQVSIHNYEEFQPVIFKFRREILEWIILTISKLPLSLYERDDIFFHFAKIFDLYVQTCKSKIIVNLEKIQSVALACLNLNLKIKSSVCFERDFTFPSGEEIFIDFYKYESKILKALHYVIIYPTIEEFTNMLTDIFIEKYQFKLNSEESILTFTKYIKNFNQYIIYDEKITFNILALDKAAVSLYCSLMIIRIRLLIEEEKFEFILKDFYNFLSDDIKVIHLDLNDFKVICSNLVISFTMCNFF